MTIKGAVCPACGGLTRGALSSTGNPDPEVACSRCLVTFNRFTGSISGQDLDLEFPITEETSADEEQNP